MDHPSDAHPLKITMTDGVVIKLDIDCPAFGVNL